MSEIFERFCDAEFSADWDAHAGPLRRRGLLRVDATHAMRNAGSTRCTRSSNAPPPPSPDAKAAIPLVNLVIDVPTLERLPRREPATCTAPADPRQRRCETVAGIPVPPSDVVAAMIWGQVRRVVVDSAGVVINMGRRQRLFTGNARQAVLLQSSRCVVAGCATPIRRCEADHLIEWGRHGHTDGANGAPVCGRHNRLKNSGYRVHRDDHGFWHTYRPDGTEIS